MAHQKQNHNYRISAKPRKPSKKLVTALTLRIREGMTWPQAAEAAGLAESTIFKARKQPHIIELYQKLENEYIQDVEKMRAPYKAQAFEHAKHLMNNAKSEQVQARMVEFLAGESKKDGVNVQINNNISGGQGYEYVKPGQRVVVIEGEAQAQDVVSDSPDTEAK
jgi:hypothetical protein